MYIPMTKTQSLSTRAAVVKTGLKATDNDNEELAVVEREAHLPTNSMKAESAVAVLLLHILFHV
jgi:hypothetical protein